MTSFRVLSLPLLLAAGVFAGTAAMAGTPKLPPKAPIPQMSERAVETPLPDEKPIAPSEDEKQALPVETGEIPVPPAKPADAVGPEKPTDEAKKPEKKPIAPDPRSTAAPLIPMPDEEVACRKRLNALGVEFEDKKAESDPVIGCSIPYPLTVRTLGPAIAIAPEAEMNCQMAEAAARFMAETVTPAAKTRFGAGLKSINQASAYVCRPRHNGRKMSEHAFGNALDIASVTLTDGTKIAVEPSPPEKEAKFLDEVRKAACGPFKTVLGPGSDADHALHFHLDLEPRRNGGTFCQ
ncbi:extensin-like domain-containing protein [Mesorhizobium sp. A556]